jgi:tetratricopeptide (TPR) repeat protein
VHATPVPSAFSPPREAQTLKLHSFEAQSESNVHATPLPSFLEPSRDAQTLKLHSPDAQSESNVHATPFASPCPRAGAAAAAPLDDDDDDDELRPPPPRCLAAGFATAFSAAARSRRPISALPEPACDDAAADPVVAHAEPAHCGHAIKLFPSDLSQATTTIRSHKFRMDLSGRHARSSCTKIVSRSARAVFASVGRATLAAWRCRTVMRSAVRIGWVNGIVAAAGVALAMVAWPRSRPDALAHAEALWHASCPVPEIDGACVAVELETPTLPTRCSPGSERRRAVIPRDARKQADALAAFAALGDRRAKLFEGDALREAALAIAVPHDSAQLSAWMATRVAARERAAAKYAELFVGGDPTTTSAALARTAQLAEDLADQLLTLEIPRSVRADEAIDAYCDALTAVAEPAIDTASKLYAACFAKATELGRVSDWSTLCETALERLDPERYPMQSELQSARDHAPWLDAGKRALQLRNYAVATQLFELAPTSYDAIIGLGIAQRGLGELDRAQASYERARDSDPSRGEAYYDLAILDKDFRSNHISDPDPVAALRRSADAYAHARLLFAQFLGKTDSSTERAAAQASMADCDKAMKEIDTYLDQR